MVDRYKPLLERSILQAELQYEYDEFRGSTTEGALFTRLTAWSKRGVLGEREIEAAFIGRFFEDTWGYRPGDGTDPDFTLRQQFAVPGAGAGGGAGSADLALGRFGAGSAVGQVLCEFKGVGADLDKPQPRKGSTRSPARQALDYLAFARRGLFGEAVLPRFALVTDMNEFRLYLWDLAPDQYLKFRIQGGDLFDASSLLSDTEADRFDRFLFWRLFQPDMLLAEFGRTRLERLIERQGASQKRLEKEFYAEYRAYRIVLYDAIKLQLLHGVSGRDKLRLAQKLLDRLVFLMFAEDMGLRVAFPPGLLRDELKERSRNRFFDPAGTDVWAVLIGLFQTMNKGGKIGDDPIHPFNGGLFEDDPALDALRLPNHLFCKRGQGVNEASIKAEKGTLLYLAATYDFASEGDAKNAIGLYTLGHIFEQSLVELEKLEADAEGRPSLTDIAKRKRDGVYYTPEPIVRRIVDETLGPLFARWRDDAGWGEGTPSRAAAEAYWTRLNAITVVDPAVGSGAFLITALRVLFAEFRAVADTLYELRDRETAGAARAGDAELTRHILEHNLHGVDINPLSVEIAQLSLWLHTARAREPLSSFKYTVRHGNSLVPPAIYDTPAGEAIGVAARERIAAFDWQTGFPDVFARGGFDAVIGNPPYVKLQNFRRVYDETARYLSDPGDGAPAYRSTQRGNFDLYLPFIERGLSLLNAGGRMGFIAPNLWPTLDYGAGLRRLIVEGRHLERWIDFRSHQVFEEATIYTAIQVFTRAPNAAVAVAYAPDGDLGAVDWNAASAIPYDELPAEGVAWLLAPEPVRRLFARLARECRRLDDPGVTRAIFQGLITSADWVYHLEWRANGRYLHWPQKVDGAQPPAIEVELEDTVMKPLVSGAEAKRFLDPATNIYLLFPYKVDADGARLWTPDEMAARFPKAWAYLHRFQRALRAREGSAFDDAEWYRFGRNQNIDKQEQPKLIVAQTVPAMRVAYDHAGDFYVNNVRVNGILPVGDGWWLLGVLNSPTIDYLFRWIGKPKDNGYYEANKQFIAPLPVPRATDAERTEVGRIARDLQRLTTERARLVATLSERLARVSRRARPHEWLMLGVRNKTAIEADAPVRLLRPDRRRWTDARYKEEVDAALARLDEMIRLDSAVEPAFEEGEALVRIDGAKALGGVYLDTATGAFLLAQWQVAVFAWEPTGKADAKRLVDALRHVGLEADAGLRDQIIERQHALAAVTMELRAREAELHGSTCKLFSLSVEERRMVEERRRY